MGDNFINDKGSGTSITKEVTKYFNKCDVLINEYVVLILRIMLEIVLIGEWNTKIEREFCLRLVFHTQYETVHNLQLEGVTSEGTGRGTATGTIMGVAK